MSSNEIIWMESEIYIARKALFPTPEAFLQGVLVHITKLVATNSEEEAGWYKVPEFDSYIPFVGISWIVHRVNMEYAWELIEKPGRGHTPVWLIDFETDIKKETLKVLKCVNY